MHETVLQTTHRANDERLLFVALRNSICVFLAMHFVFMIEYGGGPSVKFCRFCSVCNEWRMRINVSIEVVSRA
jgi:hypothetical protein